MLIQRLIAAFGVGVLAGCAGPTPSEPVPQGRDFHPLVVPLLSPDKETRRRAAGHLGYLRSRIIDDLVEIAKGPTPEDPDWSSKALAVVLLGQYRADGESPGVLLNALGFNADVGVRCGDLFAYTPAVGALIRIGNAAVEPVISQLGWPVERRTLRIYSEILRQILGQAAAVATVEERLQRVPSHEVMMRQNLTALAQILRAQRSIWLPEEPATVPTTRTATAPSPR